MAEIIPINHDALQEKRLNPDELDNKAAIDMFLSMTTHPSVSQSSQQRAKRVNQLISERARDDLTDEDIAWRARFGTIMTDVDSYDDARLEKLLGRDVYMREMYQWLTESRERAKDLAEERSAVLALRGLRATVVEARLLQETREDNRWARLVHGLGVAAIE